jgi:hypothetical protein
VPRKAKKLVSLLMKDLKESLIGEKGAKRGRDDGSEDDDAHVYKLIRGAFTVMFTQGGGDREDYRLNWDSDLDGSSDTERDQPDNKTEGKWKHRNVRFSVTLMMNQKKAGGDDHVPKDSDEDSDEDGVPVSAPGAESSSSTTFSGTLQRRLQTVKRESPEEMEK